MTEIITSTKNQFVKKARSLSQKKFRKESGLFLVEGTNVIKDMPSSVEVEYVLATLQRQDEVERSFGKERSGKSCEALAFTRAQVYYVSDEVMAYVADTVSLRFHKVPAFLCRKLSRMPRNPRPLSQNAPLSPIP